jgi:poly-gamma-glutamate synthesis protein (capsule biosynthesis protein)
MIKMKKISFVASGDSILTMRHSIHSEPEFIEIIERIRSADLAYTNLEVVLCDFEEYPAAEPGGTYMRSDPAMLDEYLWYGFDIFSTANNHSLDYSVGGLLATITNLKNAGVPYSGTGENLAESREPAYIETRGGRAALISASSSFSSFGRAGPARRDMHGRPGLNPLRHETKYVVSKKSIEALKIIARELSLRQRSGNDDVYHFLENKFLVGDDTGVHTQPNHDDLEGNLESIREAKRQADWIFFSLHCHQGREEDNFKPADFIETFARKCIDTGAHAFLGHGPHFMKGIEIRDGKPIFYSLGNFIYQNMTIPRMPAEFYERFGLNKYQGTPADAYDARSKKHHAYAGPHAYERWISFYPKMVFEGDRLVELKLYPIDLGENKPRSQRGRPITAGKKLAEKILGILKNRSKPYGTEIIVENGIGIVSL